MQPNPIQFAVVREDPRLEFGFLNPHPESQFLSVASGGCTALSLQSFAPGTAITLVDPNPAQIDLVQRKTAQILRSPPRETPALWNIGDPQSKSLCQCGNFEGLFRQLRRYVHEFVADESEILTWFAGRDEERMKEVFDKPYWNAAFDVHFNDALLNAMFGPAATQHAAAASYPAYFRNQIETALRAPDARHNYFMHHIFLGRYLPTALPEYLINPPAAFHIDYVHGTFADVPDIDRFDLVSLSNVMDWMSPEECQPMIEHLTKGMRPGARVMWRQLNNDRDRCSWFQPAFAFDHEANARLKYIERSYFYSSIHVGVKQA